MIFDILHNKINRGRKKKEKNDLSPIKRKMIFVF